ncbi:hypothetical protein SDC9_193546 [bioreactor metagenome]|uniref:Uncharacterized protein n=1 Tax=bioreactor metagenome TaxID=1076179 RepID=A0A645I3U6_9ZZZZ
MVCQFCFLVQEFLNGLVKNNRVKEVVCVAQRSELIKRDARDLFENAVGNVVVKIGEGRGRFTVCHKE